MERLTAEDRLMLWQDETWPQEMGALAIVDGRSLLGPRGRFRIRAVRAAVERRLHLIPRFRQLLHRPGRWMGGPLWVDAPGFDIRDHVRIVRVPAPADEAQLLAVTERLRRRRLDRSRPLWGMWFLLGLPDGRIGLFVKMSHAIADGVAGIATLATLLDPAPDTAPASAPPWTPAPTPTPADLMVDNMREHLDGVGRVVKTLVRPVATLRNLTSALPALREIFAQEPGPETSLDRVVGPDRNLTLVRTRLDLVKEIAHTHGAKVNDVLLAVTAGGVRTLFRSRGEEPEDVRIYVPVSLHLDRPGQVEGNLVSQMVVTLPVSEPDPVRRLRWVGAETVKRKATPRPSAGTFFHGGKLVGWTAAKLIRRQRVNLTSADVPGPPVALYFAGARLLEVFPVLPLIGRISLGVGALSYAGQFNIMAVADREAYTDLDVFAEGVREELAALSASIPVAEPAGLWGER